jgi:proline iminopeptidase
MSSTSYELFPEITPYDINMLRVGKTHEIYYEQCGNPDGYPVIFLHGGPGSGCNPTQRRFFDPSFYRIILLDQRGCGRSIPMGCIDENNTDALTQDIEALKQHLSIHEWLVFGGSWGSTLALTYAIAYPSSVTGLILRGVFLSRANELDWFLRDVNYFFPDAYQALSHYLPESDQADVLNAYAKLVFSEDILIAADAAKHWNTFENSIMALLPRSPSTNTSVTPPEIEIARARIQIHYILHQCFVGYRDLVSEAKALNKIPTTIIQGRYDMVCPPVSAWDLKSAMPHADFKFIHDAGHSAMEPGVRSALVEATEAFKNAQVQKR